MHIYLVNPPSAQGVDVVREGRCMQRQGAWTAIWAPITLATMGALLESRGFKVRLVDCIAEKITPAALKSLLADFAPQLVILNTATPSIESDLDCARLVKEAVPGAFVAACGIHPSALPEESLALAPCLDAVIRGEPELTATELAQVIAEGSDPIQVVGLSLRRDMKVITSGDRPLIADLDSLPFPAWHLVKLDRYLLPFTRRPFLLVTTGRGCPFSCSFCAASTYHGKQIRLRSPQRLVEELAWIKERFSVEDFLFWTESFTLDGNFVREFCRLILDRGLSIHWVCNSRVDQVDARMLALMKQAGCWMIGYGVESGSQSILDESGKHITVEQIRTAVTMAKEAGLEVTGHCILGLPGETMATMEETLKLTLELDLDFVQYYCSVPFPGSPLYDLARSRGWIIRNEWTWFEQNYSVMDLPDLSSNQVMAFRRRAYRIFYSRPRVLWRGIQRLWQGGGWRQLPAMLRDFLNWS